jgi:hypothetical protein
MRRARYWPLVPFLTGGLALVPRGVPVPLGPAMLPVPALLEVPPSAL